MANLPSSIGPYNYRILKDLTLTTMSRLVLAEERLSSGGRRQVVLKIARLEDENNERANQLAMQNEEERLCSLEHPNIIQLLPISEKFPSRNKVFRSKAELPGVQGAPWFIVTEFLPGGSLADLILKRQRLYALLSIEILIQIAEALDYIHKQGHVHLDIKPKNILFRSLPMGNTLAPPEKPILIDFGIARDTGELGYVQGTPQWLTPENCHAYSKKQKVETDPSMDIYPLGVLVYYILKGKIPKRDENCNFSTPFRLETGLFKNDPSIPSKDRDDIVKRINQLMERSTEHDGRKRPTASEFAKELKSIRARLVIPQKRRAKTWVASLGAGAITIFLLLLLTNMLPGFSMPPMLMPTMVLPSPEPVSVAPTSTLLPTPTIQLHTPEVTLATITPTATSIPTVTNTPIASGTENPSAEATVIVPPIPDSPTETQTSTATLTVTPTATSTPTPTRTSSSTPGPTSTISEFVIPSPTSTPFVPVITPTPTQRSAPTATATITTRSVTLISPPPNSSGSGKVQFTWEPQFTLAEDEAFEVIFWKPNQNPMINGFGVADMGKYTSIEPDLTKLANQRPDLLRPGEYLWTVFVSKKDDGNYQRVVQVGAAWRFTFTGEPGQ